MASAHRVAGLRVVSDIDLSVPPAWQGAGEADVRIRLVAEAERPADPFYEDDRFSAACGDFFFQVDEAFSFRVRGGRQIDVHLRAERDLADVRLYLLGSALGVLHHQRGELPLHCSAAEIGGEVWAFCADSGEGKSTLAAALAALGHGHVCDDVALLRPDGGRVRLWPVDKGVKLSPEAASRLALPTLGPVAPGDPRGKLRVRPPGAVTAESAVLRGVVILRSREDAAPVFTLEPLSGGRALQVLAQNVYRREWLRLLRDDAGLYRALVAVLERIEVQVFTRPRDLERLEEGAARLVEALGRPAGRIRA